MGDGARRAADVPVLMASHHRGRPAGRRLDGDRVAGRLGRATTRSARRRANACSRPRRTLDYVPNALARGLLKSHVPVVGVIVHDITDPYFSEVVRGVEDGGAPRSATSSSPAARSATPSARARTSGCCARCARRRSSSPAAASTTRPSTPRSSAHLAAMRGRWRGGRPPLAARPRRAGGRRRQRAPASPRWSAALVALGHRGSRFLAGPRRCTSRASAWPATERGLARRRHRRRRAACRRARRSTAPAGRRRRHAARRRRAVHGDLLRQRPARARRARAPGRARDRRPGRGSVAGFDDIPTAAMTAPSLSTVRLPLREIGRRGFAHADASSAGERPRRQVLPTELVLRDSTGRRRRGPAGRSPTRRARPRRHDDRPRRRRLIAGAWPVGSSSSPAAAAASAPRSRSRRPPRARPSPSTTTAAPTAPSGRSSGSGPPAPTAERVRRRPRPTARQAEAPRRARHRALRARRRPRQQRRPDAGRAVPRDRAGRVGRGHRAPT